MAECLDKISHIIWQIGRHLTKEGRGVKVKPPCTVVIWRQTYQHVSKVRAICCAYIFVEALSEYHNRTLLQRFARVVPHKASVTAGSSNRAAKLMH